MMSSNSNKVQSEYLEAVKSINLLNCLLDEGTENKLLLLVKVNKPDIITECNCTFKLLTKEKIWLKSFNFEEFTSYKAKMGFDGSWSAFFKTLEQSINKLNGGQIQIKNLKKAAIQLTILHPISDDLKIKSEIVFDKFHNSNTEEFKSLNFDTMIELYESKNKQTQNEKEKEQNKQISNMNQICTNNNSSNAKLEVVKNQKRKYNSDLINPNAKKRKAKGVKFVQDEVEESNQESIQEDA